jgi:hypothetical protein
VQATRAFAEPAAVRATEPGRLPPKFAGAIEANGQQRAFETHNQCRGY